MPDTVGIFVLLPLLIMVGPMAPYTRTIMSNTVPVAEQAKIFSAFSALEGISSLLAPLYSAGYTVFVGVGMPWLVFEVMSFACFVALLIATHVRTSPALSKHLPEDHRHHEEESIVVISPILRDDEESGRSDSEKALLDGKTATRRRSVSMNSSLSLPSEDCTTLQYCHLSHASVDATYVDNEPRENGYRNGLTERLLAESRDNLD